MFSLRKTTECLPLKPENPEESDTALTDNDDDDDDQVEDPDYQPIHREDARDMLFNLLMMRRTLRQQAPFLNHCHIKRGEKTKKNTLRIVFMAEPEATPHYWIPLDPHRSHWGSTATKLWGSRRPRAGPQQELDSGMRSM